jgi:hypothetical protein
MIPAGGFDSRSTIEVCERSHEAWARCSWIDLDAESIYSGRPSRPTTGTSHRVFRHVCYTPGQSASPGWLSRFWSTRWAGASQSRATRRRSRGLGRDPSYVVSCPPRRGFRVPIAVHAAAERRSMAAARSRRLRGQTDHARWLHISDAGGRVHRLLQISRSAAAVRRDPGVGSRLKR